MNWIATHHDYFGTTWWRIDELDDEGRFVRNIVICDNDEALAHRIAKLPKLEAFVDKLPKTADGVPQMPDDQVWSIDAVGAIRCGRVWHNAGWGVTVKWPSDNSRGPNQYDIEVERCFSTRESAEAARKEVDCE
jgi:hypothetical protein